MGRGGVTGRDIKQPRRGGGARRRKVNSTISLFHRRVNKHSKLFPAHTPTVIHQLLSQGQAATRRHGARVQRPRAEPGRRTTKIVGGVRGRNREAKGTHSRVGEMGKAYAWPWRQWRCPCLPVKWLGVNGTVPYLPSQPASSSSSSSRGSTGGQCPAGNTVGCLKFSCAGSPGLVPVGRAGVVAG